MSGVKIPKGACYFAKAKGPEGCVNPCPELTPGNVDAWRLFASSFGCLNYRGMDGIPAGHHMADVQAIAAALGLAWDENLLQRFLLLQGHWLDAHMKRVEADRNRAKK